MSEDLNHASLRPSSQDDAPPFQVRLATRVNRLPPYMFGRINALLYQKRRGGADVIDLGMGNPSEAPEDYVIDKLAEAARDPRNHGYSKSNGIVNLSREVAGKYLKKHGVPFSEAATALLDDMALVIEDPDAKGEGRWVFVGMSDVARLLTVVYTLRDNRIRVISARRAARREARSHAQGV